MGNILAITDANGNRVASADLGITCAAYFSKLAHKYDSSFDLFGDRRTLDKRLHPIYMAAKADGPHDYVTMLLFMNQKTTYTPEDIPHFERAVAEYPADFYDGPLRVITKFCDLLKRHQTLTVEYVGVDVALSVTTG